MLFIKAITTDKETEYFNLDKVLSIKHYDNGTTKLLMAAGLSWKVYSYTIELVDINDILESGL